MSIVPPAAAPMLQFVSVRKCFDSVEMMDADLTDEQDTYRPRFEIFLGILKYSLVPPRYRRSAVPPFRNGHRLLSAQSMRSRTSHA